MNQDQLPFCKCGCGRKVSKLSNKWINGHNKKNIIVNSETREKIRIGNKGRIPWNKGKTKNDDKRVLKQSKKIKNLQNDSTSIYNSYEYKKRHMKAMNRKEVKDKISKAGKGRSSPNKGKSMKHEQKEKISKTLKITLEQLQERYPFFCQIEDVKEGSKPGTFFVHCHNHNCPNSKEKDGCFLANYDQLYERIRALENNNGNDGQFLYCSKKCKQDCPSFNLHGDPYKNIEKSYTSEEYQTFRKFVLERDNYICQFCGKLAEYVHHERPQKLEPFFVLDPDMAWSCCEKCHYKYGHKDECSTGNLANKIC